jgi:hypothetical protein
MSNLLFSKQYDQWKLDTPEYEESKEIDYNTIELDGIDTKDYPDFCDAYISYCEYTDGTELSDIDYNKLNDDGDLIHKLVYKKLF